MISILLEEAIVHHNELPIPAVLYGVIALAGFLALGAVTWSYRDVSNRNMRRSNQQAGH
ncbi:MAG: hypothetical protein JXR02_04445 [Aquiluna sp.]